MKKTRACKNFERYWNRAPHGQPWSPRDTNTTPEKQFYPGKQFHALELWQSIFARSFVSWRAEFTSDRVARTWVVLLAIIHCMNKHICNVLVISSVVGPLSFVSKSRFSNNWQQLVTNHCLSHGNTLSVALGSIVHSEGSHATYYV